MVGVGGSNPLGRTKSRSLAISGAFLFVKRLDEHRRRWLDKRSVENVCTAKPLVWGMPWIILVTPLSLTKMCLACPSHDSAPSAISSGLNISMNSFMKSSPTLTHVLPTFLRYPKAANQPLKLTYNLCVADHHTCMQSKACSFCRRA